MPLYHFARGQAQNVSCGRPPDNSRESVTKRVRAPTALRLVSGQKRSLAYKG